MKKKIVSSHKGEKYNLNSPVSFKKIESKLNQLITFQRRMLHVQMISLFNSTKHLRKKWHNFSTNSSRKWKQREHFHSFLLTNSFYEVNSTLIPDKDIKREENAGPKFLMDIDAKILGEILANLIQ